MPRWYALCKGHPLPACDRCRRNAAHHPNAANDRQQSWVGPDLHGQHCRNFIEQPPHVHATTPTDQR